jgi:hypothetical protein
MARRLALSWRAGHDDVSAGSVGTTGIRSVTARV